MLRQIIDALIYKSAVPAGRRCRARGRRVGENVAFNQKAVVLRPIFWEISGGALLQDFICPLNSRLEYHPSPLFRLVV